MSLFKRFIALLLGERRTGETKARGMASKPDPLNVFNLHGSQSGRVLPPRTQMPTGRQNPKSFEELARDARRQALDDEEAQRKAAARQSARESSVGQQQARGLRNNDYAMQMMASTVVAGTTSSDDDSE